MEKDTKIILFILAAVTLILIAVGMAINSGAIKISPSLNAPVVLYMDINYQGSYQGYDAGAYNLSQMEGKGTLNDTLSSIEINSGFTVTLFQDDSLMGESITISKSDPTLVDDGWNDRASSMVIIKTPQQ